MSSYNFLVRFEYSIFSFEYSILCFYIKNSHHLSCCAVLVFITFRFLAFICEPEISRSSHRKVILIIMVPVGVGREKTYEDVIL